MRTVRNIRAYARVSLRESIIGGQSFRRLFAASHFRSRYYTLSRVNKFTRAAAIAHGTAHFNIEPAWARVKGGARVGGMKRKKRRARLLI